MANPKIEDVEGIGPVIGGKLRAAGVADISGSSKLEDAQAKEGVGGKGWPNREANSEICEHRESLSYQRRGI